MKLSPRFDGLDQEKRRAIYEILSGIIGIGNLRARNGEGRIGDEEVMGIIRGEVRRLRL